MPVTRKATTAARMFPVHLKDLSDGSCCTTRMLSGRVHVAGLVDTEGSVVPGTVHKDMYDSWYN